MKSEKTKENSIESNYKRVRKTKSTNLKEPEKKYEYFITGRFKMTVKSNKPRKAFMENFNQHHAFKIYHIEGFEFGVVDGF